MAFLVTTLVMFFIVEVSSIHGTFPSVSGSSSSSEAGGGTCGRENRELLSCKLNDLYRDIKELKDDMKLLKMKHKIDVKHLRTEHRVEMDDLKSEHEEQVGTMKEEHAKIIAQLEYEMQKLKEGYLKQNATLKRMGDLTSSLNDHCRLLPSDICGKCTCLNDEWRYERYYCSCQHLDTKRDCREHYEYGHRVSGVYRIHNNRLKTVQVYCDQESDGGGWTVIQRRLNGRLNFYENWMKYKTGFGSPHGEFWLGNDNIYILTLQSVYPSGAELRIDMTDWNETALYAKYSNFLLGSEETNYTVRVNGYSGNCGDSFSYHNGLSFSTYDRDNDADFRHCSETFRGAWWYKSCHYSNLNGEYRLKDQPQPGFARSLVWYTFKGYEYSMKTVEMKVRRKDVRVVQEEEQTKKYKVEIKQTNKMKTLEIKPTKNSMSSGNKNAAEKQNRKTAGVKLAEKLSHLLPNSIVTKKVSPQIRNKFLVMQKNFPGLDLQRLQRPLEISQSFKPLQRGSPASVPLQRDAPLQMDAPLQREPQLRDDPSNSMIRQNVPSPKNDGGSSATSSRTLHNSVKEKNADIMLKEEEEEEGEEEMIHDNMVLHKLMQEPPKQLKLEENMLQDPSLGVGVKLQDRLWQDLTVREAKVQQRLLSQGSSNEENGHDSSKDVPLQDSANNVPLQAKETSSPDSSKHSPSHNSLRDETHDSTEDTHPAKPSKHLTLQESSKNVPLQKTSEAKILQETLKEVVPPQSSNQAMIQDSNTEMTDSPTDSSNDLHLKVPSKYDSSQDFSNEIKLHDTPKDVPLQDSSKDMMLQYQIHEGNRNLMLQSYNEGDEDDPSQYLQDPEKDLPLDTNLIYQAGKRKLPLIKKTKNVTEIHKDKKKTKKRDQKKENQTK